MADGSLCQTSARQSCESCGIEFKPSRRSQRQRIKGQRARYCSMGCTHAAWKREAADRLAAPPAAKPMRHCSGCGSVLATAQKRYCSKDCRPKRIAVKVCNAARACNQCGTQYQPKNIRSQFCSVTCGRRSPVNRQRRAANRRASRKGNRDKRGKDRARARRHGAFYEPVSRLRIFGRDNWRCQICGCKTPKSLKGTFKQNAPELDHRVPLALGGAHSYANCQCACRRCNGKKGGKAIAGQIPLFERAA